MQVADDVFLGTSAGGGPDDDPAGESVLVAELAHDAAKPARSSRESILRDTPT
jgi:hypothetical protein